MKISYVLPEKILTNEELEKLYNSPQWTASKIFRKTGINKRHVVREDELVSDLSISAAEKLFKEHCIDRSSVDFLLLCTQSPDYFLPATSCIVQDKLNLNHDCGAFDFNLGCSGFVYGIALAKSLLLSGESKNILLITSETYTRHIHSLDRSTRTIFGDAAAATLINIGDINKFHKFVFGTDGAGANNLIIRNGGMANREQSNVEKTDESGNIRTDGNLYMNGTNIFSFTLKEIPTLIRKVLLKNQIDINNIDYFIFHQANRFLLETLRNEINIPEEKFCIDIEDIGNTVSSTIPIALRRAMDRGDVHEGMKVLIAGFGVGYSWGATVITL